MRSSSTGSASSSATEPARSSGRQRILLAAEHVFARDGVEGARMDAIATQAGIARSHLYYHFKSKEEIFDALIEMRTASMLATKAAVFDRFAVSSSSQGDGDLEPIIREAIEQVMVPNRDFLRLCVAEAVRRPELPEGIRQLVGEVVKDTLTRIGQPGQPDPSRASAVFHLLVVPVVMAVVLPPDPLGGLADAGDLAPLLAKMQRLLFDA